MAAGKRRRPGTRLLSISLSRGAFRQGFEADGVGVILGSCGSPPERG